MSLKSNQKETDYLEINELLQRQDIDQMMIDLSVGFVVRMHYESHSDDDYKNYLDQIFTLSRLREFKGVGV
jgi:hypothetical protein